MKNKLVKKLLGAALSATLAVSMLAGCGETKTSTSASVSASASKEETKTETKTETSKETETSVSKEEEKPAEPVVIRYGTHWVAGLDPNNMDEVTGEYTMAENERQAGLAALKAVKDELNVEFEFVNYAQDTRVELMTSVLAGDPVCEIANIWGGAESTVLAQNVLQPIDDYAYLFDDDQTSWMLDDKIYGHNYLLSFTERFIPRWPLVYNVTMIEEAGLEDPAKVFKDGNWTWSKFKEYLQKLEAFYADKPVNDDRNHYEFKHAYVTDYRFAGLSAMYSNGGAIYGSKGLTVDSQETIDALAFVKELFDEKLLLSPGVYDDGYVPRWCEAANDFQGGNTVFTDCPDWWLGGNGDNLAARNESQGIVPWPRADRLSLDSPEYTQVMTISDSVGILKGIDPAKTELAVKAYRLYWLTYYKTLGNVEDLSEYQSVMGATQAASFGFDVYNETHGQDILDAFVYVSQNLGYDYSDMLGMRVAWDDIFGKGLYGIDGMSDNYSVAVAANKTDFTKVADEMTALLSSDEIHDNQKPDISAKDVVVPVGTDLNTINVADYWTASDSVDGELDVTKGTFTVSNGEKDDEDAPDTSKVGEYAKALKLEVSDAAGNKNSARAKVVVFNPDNKTAPTLTAKEELPTVKMDTDTATINWKDFIAEAKDADGLDVSANVTADMSTLDASTPGDYTVKLTVTDFAGNSADLEITVKVVAE